MRASSPWFEPRKSATFGPSSMARMASPMWVERRGMVRMAFRPSGSPFGKAWAARVLKSVNARSCAVCCSRSSKRFGDGLFSLPIRQGFQIGRVINPILKIFRVRPAIAVFRRLGAKPAVAASAPLRRGDLHSRGEGGVCRRSVRRCDLEPSCAWAVHPRLRSGRLHRRRVVRPLGPLGPFRARQVFGHAFRRAVIRFSGHLRFRGVV